MKSMGALSLGQLCRDGQGGEKRAFVVAVEGRGTPAGELDKPEMQRGDECLEETMLQGLYNGREMDHRGPQQPSVEADGVV